MSTVTLDLCQFGGAAFVVDALRKCPTRNSVSLALADQIEAQTKPPRIPEPGWGEKVIARVVNSTGPRREFIHAYDGRAVGSVWTDTNGFHAAWSDLMDPEQVTR